MSDIAANCSVGTCPALKQGALVLTSLFLTTFELCAKLDWPSPARDGKKELVDRPRAGSARHVNPMSTSARNQSQPASPKSGWGKPYPRPAEAPRNRLRRNGREGVNGSSPLEGFGKSACK